MEGRKVIIDQVLELELAMFLAVPTGHKYCCQEDPDGFRIHRRAQFSGWSAETLKSYCADLLWARGSGRNLVAIKYARMDSLVPCENFSPIINAIVDLAVADQRQFIADYPRLMRRGRPLGKAEDAQGLTSFETYLRCELETFSEKTLQLLHEDILALRKIGSSLSEATYRSLARQLGFKSLESLEERLREG